MGLLTNKGELEGVRFYPDIYLGGPNERSVVGWAPQFTVALPGDPVFILQLEDIGDIEFTKEAIQNIYEAINSGNTQ